MSLARWVSFLALIGTGGLVIAGVWTAITLPTIDAVWRPDGGLEWVLPSSAISARLDLSDRVIQIDGQDVDHTGQILTRKQPGDTLTLLLQRDTAERQETFELHSKSVQQLVMQYGTPLSLAIVFWAIGALLIVNGSPGGNPSDAGALAGGFFALVGAELALGAHGNRAFGWLFQTYSAGLWVIGPVGTWLHLTFPRPYRLTRTPWLVPTLFVMGAAGMIWGSVAPPDYADLVNATAHRTAYIWLTGNILVSIALLIVSWWRKPDSRQRRQLGVVALGAILALVPLLTVELAPRLLGQASIDEQRFSMLLLVLLPASYGYAIRRYRRLAQDQERFLIRLLRYAFAASLASLAIMLVLALPPTRELSPNLQAWTAIVGGGLATPIVMALFEHIWSFSLFGRVRDPLREAAAATDAIDLGIEAEDLSAQVGGILRELLGIEHSAVMILDDRRKLMDVSSTGRARAAEGIEIPERSDLAEWLSGKSRVLELDEQRERLSARPARALLDVPWAQAVIPLRTQRDLIGVLLIGYRDGKPFLDEEDILVLGMVSRAVATTLQRRSLVKDLRERNEEASLLSQELLRVREDERKRIARDLHDEVIQNLIAVSYGLATIEHQPGPALRDQVLHVIERARTVCFDLRQFQQDTLGLGGAVRHVADEFAERTGLRTLAHVAEDPGVVVPETLSTAILGILEETLNNVRQHAQASLVEIWINVAAEEVVLRVCDNGVGFDRLKQTRGERATRHFGLAMMDERAALVSGQLEVRSSPGNGTEVVFEATLQKAEAMRSA